MEQRLNRTLRLVGFIFLYLSLGLINSACKLKTVDYVVNENIMAIYVEAEENPSPEINIFDIEDDTEDQEKVISHLILAGVWSI